MANVTAVIGLAGQRPGGTAIEDLWRLASVADNAGDAGQMGTVRSAAAGSAGATRLFADCTRELLQSLAWADRTGLFLHAPGPRGGDGGSGASPGAPEGGGAAGSADSAGSAGSDIGDAAAALASELGLSGPAATVDGPPLAAVERACRSLHAGECDLALAGEASAGGGAFAVALKRLPAALAEGATVLALVDAAAVGNLLPPPPPMPRAAVPAAVGQAAPSGPSAASEPSSPAAEPPRTRPALASPYEPPVNPLEAAIAAVWQEELGIEQVGVEDNFFELGGTSIAGVKIIALLKDWLHQPIPTVSLYEGPTVRALAQVLLHSGHAQGYGMTRERGERRRRKLQHLQGSTGGTT